MSTEYRIIKLNTGYDLIAEVILNPHTNALEVTDTNIGKFMYTIDPHVIFVSHATGEPVTFMYRYTNGFNEEKNVMINTASIVSIYTPRARVVEYYEKVRIETSPKDDLDELTGSEFDLENWNPATSPKGLS